MTHQFTNNNFVFIKKLLDCNETDTVNLPTVRKMLLMRAFQSPRTGNPCSNDAYLYFFAHFVKCIVGLIKFNRGWNTGNLYKLVTPSDEALALLLLENNEERWIAEHAQSTENVQRDDAAPMPDLPLSKYTSNGKKQSRGYTKKNQGWKEAGVIRFNALVVSVINDRRLHGGKEWQDKLREYIKRVIHKDLSDDNQTNNDGHNNNTINGAMPVRVRAHFDMLESDSDEEKEITSRVVESV